MFDVKLMGGALGAELSGVDLTKELSGSVLSEIRKLLIKHCLLYTSDAADE